jgi:microcystin-dependent protein
MASPYVGEIRMFGGNFAPAGWMLCEGQILPISENEVLFELIGTTYGGDGESTFALPDLRGRVPIHQGNGFVLAEQFGTETVTLTIGQTPAHTHALVASSDASNQSTPIGSMLANATAAGAMVYGTGTLAAMAPAISSVGGSQPHENLMPILAVNFIISLFGIFPTQS